MLMGFHLIGICANGPSWYLCVILGCPWVIFRLYWYTVKKITGGLDERPRSFWIPIQKDTGHFRPASFWIGIQKDAGQICVFLNG